VGRTSAEVHESGNGELSEFGWDLVDEATSKQLTKPLSWMRKRAGKKWFDTFIRVVLEALLGRFEGFSDEPKKGNVQDDEWHILEKGLRLEQANAGPWPKFDIEAYLKDIGRLAGKGSLQQELNCLTDKQLIEARNEARSWLALLGVTDSCSRGGSADGVPLDLFRW
jgi:hypothetical protein